MAVRLPSMPRSQNAAAHHKPRDFRTERERQQDDKAHANALRRLIHSTPPAHRARRFISTHIESIGKPSPCSIASGRSWRQASWKRAVEPAQLAPGRAAFGWKVELMAILAPKPSLNPAVADPRDVRSNLDSPRRMIAPPDRFASPQEFCRSAHKQSRSLHRRPKRQRVRKPPLLLPKPVPLST